jgi:hypothetical protein
VTILYLGVTAGRKQRRNIVVEFKANMFNQNLIKMKTVVFLSAAAVLMLISLGNLNHDCKAAPCEKSASEPATEINVAGKTEEKPSVESSASSDVQNFSGKNTNFYFITF